MEGHTDLGHGIHRITVPLPIAQLPFVNCYVFEGEQGATLLDCGADTPDGRQVLAHGIESAGFQLSELHSLIGSHLHPDHIGYAAPLVAEADCELVMHSNAVKAVPFYNDWNIRYAEMADWVNMHGGPTQMVEELRAGDPRPDWAGHMIEPTTTVEDGAKIPLSKDRWLEAIYTPGHDTSHISLVDSRTGLLFSGDHVLPRITPFIPYLGERHDTLGDYLDSLERIELLDPGVTHPAHGVIIERGRARARQITLHHERRLGAMTQELRSGPRTAWQIMEAIFRPNLMGFEQRLAIQETLAHLEHLRGQGQISRFEEDGVYWYRR